MAINPEERPLDHLWQEYGRVFETFDDLSLARWMAQTLGQMSGHLWRLSHPLQGAYRLAAQIAHQRQIWLKRLVLIPASYTEAACCRAPLLPLFTREINESGLICQHCGETAVPFSEIPNELRRSVARWAEEYSSVHEVAHWEDAKKQSVASYEQAFDGAAEQATLLLGRAREELAMPFLDLYPAMVWEDQDECLDVHPEDILV